MKLAVITLLLSLAGGDDVMRIGAMFFTAIAFPGIMKPACQEACPGAKAMLDRIQEQATATSTTTAAPGRAFAVMCPHLDAMDCMIKADACKATRRLDAHGNATNATSAEGDATSAEGNATSASPPPPPPPTTAAPSEEQVGGATSGGSDGSGGGPEGGSEGGTDMTLMSDLIGCACACPKMNTDENGQLVTPGLKAMCADPEGLFGCLMKESKCSAMKTQILNKLGPFNPKDFPKDMKPMQFLGMACAAEENKCGDKKCDSEMGNGSGQMPNKCFSKDTTDRSVCCTPWEEMTKCQGDTCMKLMVSMMTMRPDDGTSGQFLAISKACPAAGMPSSKDEVKAVMEAQEKQMMGEESTAADTTASGAFVPAPVFGVVAAVLASTALCNF